jgi:hypothetical protein
MKLVELPTQPSTIESLRALADYLEVEETNFKTIIWIGITDTDGFQIGGLGKDVNTFEMLGILKAAGVYIVQTEFIEGE